MRKLGVLLLVLTGSLFAGVSHAAAAELKVDDDQVQCPTAPYTSIQAAVNAAAPGDTVKVCPGTYTEQVTIGAGKNGLKVISDKELQATIKAPLVMADPGDIVRINRLPERASEGLHDRRAAAGHALLLDVRRARASASTEAPRRRSRRTTSPRSARRTRRSGAARTASASRSGARPKARPERRRSGRT